MERKNKVLKLDWKGPKKGKFSEDPLEKEHPC